MYYIFSFYLVIKTLFYNEKCIYIETMGGLGNQIFQVVFLYCLSKKFNINYKILYSNNNPHNEQNLKYYETIFKKFNTELNFENENTEYFEQNFCKYENIKEISKNMKFVGYFQNEKYFKDRKTEILELLTSNFVYDKIENSNSFFIHIRRGDYLNITLHYINLDIYYKNCIEYILRIDNNAHFYIISDDIEFCKNYSVLDTINKTFYENSNELETLYFMSKCNKVYIT